LISLLLLRLIEVLLRLRLGFGRLVHFGVRVVVVSRVLLLGLLLRLLSRMLLLLL
jgi:hypothetical protein